jgi:hypothetical protein
MMTPFTKRFEIQEKNPLDVEGCQREMSELIRSEYWLVSQYLPQLCVADLGCRVCAP